MILKSKEEIEEEKRENNPFEDNSDYSNESNNGLKDFFEANKKILIVLGILLLAVIIILCVNSCSNNNPKNPVTIVVENNNIEISVGSSYKIEASVLGVSNPSLSFSSSDTSICTVDAQGNVTGINTGEARVIISYTDINDANGKIYSEECIVIVKDGDSSIDLTSLTFPDGKLELPVGYSYTLIKNATPSNGYINKIEYSVGDPSIISVSDTGVVKGLKEGSTTVSFKANDRFSDTMKVTVTKTGNKTLFLVPPTSASFAKSSYNIEKGSSMELVVDTRPTYSFNDEFNWSTSNSNVATVKDGKVTANGTGEATITVTYNNITASTKIIVGSSSVKPTSIKTGDTAYTLKIGETHNLNAKLSPSNASGGITYRSYNTGVVTIDQNGKMTGISEGSATVIAYSSIDPSINRTASVVVTGNGSYVPPKEDTKNCSNSNAITLKSNTGGAVLTKYDPNYKTKMTEKNLELTLTPTSSCGTLNSIQYCYGYNRDTCSTSYKTMSGDKLNIQLPTGSGYMYMNFKVKYNKEDSYIKEYWMLYNNAKVTESDQTSKDSIKLSTDATYQNSSYGAAKITISSKNGSKMERIFYCVTDSATTYCDVSTSVNNSNDGIVTVGDAKSAWKLNGNRDYSAMGSSSASKTITLATASKGKVCFKAKFTDGTISSRACVSTLPGPGTGTGTSTIQTTTGTYTLKFVYEGTTFNLKYGNLAYGAIVVSNTSGILGSNARLCISSKDETTCNITDVNQNNKEYVSILSKNYNLYGQTLSYKTSFIDLKTEPNSVYGSTSSYDTTKYIRVAAWPNQTICISPMNKDSKYLTEKCVDIRSNNTVGRYK